MSELTKQLIAEEWSKNSEDSDEYVVIEEDDWKQSGKYQFCNTLVQTKDGKFWRIYQSRSGSYHSDWYYDEPDVTEVEPYTETITIKKWKNV